MAKVHFMKRISIHACGDPKCNCLKIKLGEFVETREDDRTPDDCWQVSVDHEELPSFAAAIMEHYKSHGGKTQ